MNTSKNVSTISSIFNGDFSVEAQLRTISNMHFIAAAKVKSAATKVLVAESMRERNLLKDDAGHLVGNDDRPNDKLPQIDGQDAPAAPDHELADAMHFFVVADHLLKDVANNASDIDDTTNRTIEFKWMVRNVPSMQEQLKKIAKEFAQFQGIREASKVRADAIRPGLTPAQRVRMEQHAQEIETNGVHDSYHALYTILNSAQMPDTSHMSTAEGLSLLLELAADCGYSDDDMYKAMYQQVTFYRKSFDEYLTHKEAGVPNNVNIRPRLDTFVAILGEVYEERMAESKKELDDQLAIRQRKAEAARARFGLSSKVANEEPAQAPVQEPVNEAKKGRRVPKAA